MATTIKTVMTYPLDGSTTDFNISFEYLARKFVRVTLIGQDRKELTLNQDYRFATKTTISLSRAWGSADGYTMIEFRRYTSASERLVDFTDGSILRAYDLNTSQVQTLHVAEEARDLTADTIGVNNSGDLDARGRRIVNVGDAVDAGDALNLGQVQRWNDSALNSANRADQQARLAEDARNSAYVYRDNALAYRNDSYAYRTQAEEYRNTAWQYQEWAKGFKNDANDAATRAVEYRNTAWQYQDWAKGYKENAEASATTAHNEADRAKEEADKLGNMNALGGALGGVTPDNTVIFKGNTVGRGYYWTNENGQVVYSSRVSGGKLEFGSDSNLTQGTPMVRMPGIRLTASQLYADDGVVRWFDGSNQFNMTLNASTLNINRAGVDTFAYNGMRVIGIGALGCANLVSTGGITAGSAVLGTDGNLVGSIFSTGNLKGDLNTKADVASVNAAVDNLTSAVNSKVSESTAAGKYLVDVAHGARVANPLWDKQGAFEVQAGHSLCGWLTATGDGSIRYANWISRGLVKRVENSGWIQCGNIS